MVLEMAGLDRTSKTGFPLQLKMADLFQFNFPSLSKADRTNDVLEFFLFLFFFYFSYFSLKILVRISDALLKGRIPVISALPWG